MAKTLMAAATRLLELRSTRSNPKAIHVRAADIRHAFDDLEEAVARERERARLRVAAMRARRKAAPDA